VRFEVSRALDAMEQRLTTDITLAQAVVDVAQIVRYADLDGGRTASLLRLGLVVDALARHLHDGGVLVYPVVDRALTSDLELTSNEKMVLRRWADDGLAELLPQVEDRIVEIADITGLPVVSRDDFARFGAAYPWISQVPGWLLAPVPGIGGAALISRPSGTPVPRPVSPRARVLERSWRCNAFECPLFGPARVYDQPPPRLRGGVPICPVHGQQLQDVGLRPPAVAVAVRVGEAMRGRFAVRASGPTVVGRSPEDPAGVRLGPWLDERAAGWVSRSHLVLELQGDALVVTDTSTNGTVVLTRNGPGEPPQRIPLSRGQRRRLGQWDTVELTEGVTLGTLPAMLESSDGGADDSVMSEAPTMALRLPPR